MAKGTLSLTEIINPINEALKPFHHRAIKIVNLACDDLLVFPEDGFNFSTNNSITTYQHIRVFSARFSELNNESGHTFNFRVNQVISILIEIFEIQGKGLEILAAAHNRTLDEVHQFTDNADIFNAGLIEKYPEPDNLPSGHIYFLVMALNSLVDFVNLYSSSFNTLIDRESSKIRETSYQQVINSMGALMSAQNAMSKGMNYQTFNVAKGRISNLTEEIDSLKSLPSNIKNTTSTEIDFLKTQHEKYLSDRRKGGEATANKRKPLINFIKTEGEAIWKNDFRKEFRIGDIAKSLKSDVEANPGKVGLNRNEIPTTLQFFKDHLKEVAPKHASLGGRSPKKME
jgi:hypothetical protein